LRFSRRRFKSRSCELWRSVASQLTRPRLESVYYIQWSIL